MDDPQYKALIEVLHQEACANGLDHYQDPILHLPVNTRLSHLKRGYCCKSGCRHCPYGFERENESKD